MRRWVPLWLAMAGLAAWFMPWTATASADGYMPIEVSCPAAPIDLMRYSGSGMSTGWSMVTPSGDTITAAGNDGACHTSAWWRTMLGTVLLAVGLGRATRVRREDRPRHLALA
jgi:hypothetical protein